VNSEDDAHERAPPSASSVSSTPLDPRIAPRRFSLFRLAAFRACEIAARAAGGRAYYRRAYLAAARLRVREESVRVAGLPRALEGFRVAHLSDIHAGPFLRRGDLRDVVRAVNALEPDVCAITGDFITHASADALLVLDDLAELRARRGVFAVFGNHDYRGRREGEIADAYAARGVRFLRNASARLAVDGGALALVGLEDLEEARVIDLERARASVQRGDVELVLCHNPARARQLAGPRCACILCGHTHGTQIDLPLLRRLGPKHPGSRFFAGDTHVIVNRGLGVVGLPLRVRSPAEIVLVRLCGGRG
jgi:predicted MPP superfamily phosphohydrolase